MRTGTEEYSFELVKSLAASGLSREHEIVLFVKRRSRIGFALPSGFSVREIGGDFLWTQLSLSWELLRRPVDVLFVPAHTVPIVHPRRTVATVHGLEFRRCPDCYSRRARWLLEINTRLALRSASRVIVPSQGTRKDLMAIYGIEDKRISVISHGAPGIRPRADAGAGGTFDVLFVGRLERRKNVVRMVRAFDCFLDSLPAAESARLILAGALGFGGYEIEREIAACRHKDAILVKGYVPEEEKQELYASASAFFFPTLAEGFGLPILEAMSHGVPVIASRGGAAEEVSGGAALLVDPEDEAEMARALAELHRDRSKRGDLRRKGYENLSRFSWQKCARETWEVLKNR